MERRKISAADIASGERAGGHAEIAAMTRSPGTATAPDEPTGTAAAIPGSS